MNYEANLSNIILRIKEAKASRADLSLQKISDHTGVSLTTVTRIFSDDSESRYFRYESIQPIANMLLGLNDLDEGNEDEKALKAIIQFKDSEIEELKGEMRVLQQNYETKISLIEKKNEEIVNYYRKQAEIKDEQISRILSRLEKQDDMAEYLTKQYFNAISQIIKEDQK